MASIILPRPAIQRISNHERYPVMIVSRCIRKYCCHLVLGVMLWCFGSFSNALHAQTEEHHFPFGMKPMVYRALPSRSITINKNHLQDEDIIGTNTQTYLNYKNSGEWNTYSPEFKTWIV